MVSQRIKISFEIVAFSQIWALFWFFTLVAVKQNNVCSSFFDGPFDVLEAPCGHGDELGSIFPNALGINNNSSNNNSNE